MKEPAKTIEKMIIEGIEKLTGEAVDFVSIDCSYDNLEVNVYFENEVALYCLNEHSDVLQKYKERSLQKGVREKVEKLVYESDDVIACLADLAYLNLPLTNITKLQVMVEHLKEFNVAFAMVTYKGQKHKMKASPYFAPTTYRELLDNFTFMEDEQE